jgi:hypothetical protein
MYAGARQELLQETRAKKPILTKELQRSTFLHSLKAQTMQEIELPFL